MMTVEQAKALRKGAVLTYDDRRKGHRGVKAIVLTSETACLQMCRFAFENESATQGSLSVPKASLIVGNGENRVLPPVREVFPNRLSLEQVL